MAENFDIRQAEELTGAKCMKIHQYNECVMSREKNHIGHFGSSLSQSYSKWQKLKSSTTASPHVVVLCRMLL